MSLFYLNESQCILAILSPGKVKIAPTNPQVKAMKNLTTIFDAGPEECSPWPCKNVEALSLKLRYAWSSPTSKVVSGTMRMIMAINK